MKSIFAALRRYSPSPLKTTAAYAFAGVVLLVV